DDLAGHREHLEAHGQAAIVLEAQGQEVKEQRSIVLRLEGHQAALGVPLRSLMQGLQVGCLSAEGGTIVDELDGQLTRSKVKLHGSLPEASDHSLQYARG